MTKEEVLSTIEKVKHKIELYEDFLKWLNKELDKLDRE